METCSKYAQSYGCVSRVKLATLLFKTVCMQTDTHYPCIMKHLTICNKYSLSDIFKQNIFYES